MRRKAFVVATALMLGCRAVEPEELLTAVLTGTVRRGPITPLCQQGVPCDEPFSASFDVRRGNNIVATFVAGADGAFTVKLPAGELTVVPHADAPLMHPTSQGKPVTLQTGALTVVELSFDTGIR